MTTWIDYDEHARTRPRTDFWGQVRRTVQGCPVDPAQIDMIVRFVRETLGVRPADHLLDLACGNGTLTARVDPVSLAYTAATMRQVLAPEVGLLLAVHPMVGECDVLGLEGLARET